MEKFAGAKSQRSKVWRRILFGAVGVVLLGGASAFLFVGRWLVVEDPIEKAQAIAVLSGAMPLRAEEAAKLYRGGYAPHVWLTHSTQPGAELKSMGIDYVGEDSYDAQILLHGGVPSEAVRVLDPPIENTADEIRAISGQLDREKEATIIIVTSKAHTRRTRILWRRLAPKRLRAIVRGASEDPFNPRRWWRSTADALDVVREILGVLNAWAGLPLQPSR
ncbi:MAG TPA: YdcF family protein [Candidatus Methylomirabilis sp.]|nr:YdcF family protein [Candidatus Methylomirabilis sp.]